MGQDQLRLSTQLSHCLCPGNNCCGNQRKGVVTHVNINVRLEDNLADFNRVVLHKDKHVVNKGIVTPAENLLRVVVLELGENRQWGMPCTDLREERLGLVERV